MKYQVIKIAHCGNYINCVVGLYKPIFNDFVDINAAFRCAAKGNSWRKCGCKVEVKEIEE